MAFVVSCVELTVQLCMLTAKEMSGRVATAKYISEPTNDLNGNVFISYFSGWSGLDSLIPASNGVLYSLLFFMPYFSSSSEICIYLLRQNNSPLPICELYS